MNGTIISNIQSNKVTLYFLELQEGTEKSNVQNLNKKATVITFIAVV